MTRGFRSQRVLFLCMSLILLAGGSTIPVYAQFNSGFTGVVVDQNQAALPDARINVTNQATGVTQASVSSVNGNFRIPSLAGGTYTIEVNADGFKTWVEKDVLLESNEVKTLYPSLALPTQTTSITVNSTVGAIETD
ncbi:MAG: hypothetical protein QOE55_4020, partial [Acidobacteriaceae bacterium]|nr:hypothetical protein [Acidobacteriaceae bacterium]